MFETIKAKIEAVDFYRLVQAYNNGQLDGFELINREVSSKFLEKITVSKDGLTSEFYLRRNRGGDFTSANLVTCSKDYGNVEMKVEEDGFAVTLKRAKNNFNHSKIIEVKMDNNGRVESIITKKEDTLVRPDRAGIKQDLIARLLRAAARRKALAKNISANSSVSRTGRL